MNRIYKYDFGPLSPGTKTITIDNEIDYILDIQEQSGHIIFREYATTGDGVLSSLQFMDAIKGSEKPLSELASIMEVLPQALVNAKVPNHKKDRYMEYPEIAAAIETLNAKFAGEGRVLIRPSGTEPKVKFYYTAVAPTIAKAQALLEAMKTQMSN